MQKLAFFPPANSIRMVPYNKVLATAHNYYGPDDAILEDQRRPFEIPSKVCQKTQYSTQQHLVFYLPVDDISSVVVQILDVNGTQVGSDLTSPLTASYPYEYQDGNENTYSTLLYYYRWAFDNINHPEGIYTVYVKITYSDTSTEEYRSEPLWVRAKHPGTIELTYSNSTDDYDILFSVCECTFTLRINSDYLTMEPASDDVVFDDQDNNTRRLFGNPYRVYKLNIGGRHGVPAYMMDKVNRALAMDTFAIENKRYVKNEGASFEITSFETTQLQFGTIQLKDWYNDSVGAYITDEVLLFTIPDISSFISFSIDGYVMRDTVSGKLARDIYPHYFDNLTEVDAYITFFNNTYKPAQLLSGTYVRVSDKVYYRNGAGENFGMLSPTTVRTTYLSFTVNVTNAAAPFGYTYGGKGAHVVFWGQGEGVKITEPGHTGTGIPIESNLGSSITYSSTGNKTVRIYTDNEMTVLKFLAQVNMVTAISSTTKVSSKLQRFWAVYQGLSGTLNIDFLRNADAALREFNFSHNAITGYNSGWAGSLTYGFPLLRYMHQNNNAFTSTTVDNYFIEIHTNMAWASGWGQINIQDQSSAAPPTGTSATERAALIAAFWTLNTD